MPMAYTSSKRRSKHTLATALVCIVIAIALLLIGGVLALYRHFSAPQATVPPAPTEEQTLPQPTQAPAVVSADGRSESLLCRASYSRLPSQADPGKAVAAYAGETLTAGELQIYYLNAIRSYQLEETSESPDYTQPLETQACPLDENLSWQHYFLSRAISAWQAETMLLQAAQESRPIQEEAFKPNETDDLHGKYVAAELPVNDFLYSDQPCYKPNSMHQDYLDDLENQLDSLARDQGYAGLADCVESAFGGTLDTGALTAAAIRYNTAYMFFTEESYDIAVTEEEVDDYVKEHASQLPGKDQDTVDMRHVLLIPEGAKVAADGTITATDAQWEACKKEAESILQSWSWDYLNSLGRDYNFSRLAAKQSRDLGSRVGGGLYQNIRPGQLAEPLDEWCFDPNRKTEDVEILRSKLGYHIVFFCGSNSAARTAARQALTERKQLEKWEKRLEKEPCNVDYSAVALWVEAALPFVAPVDVLYPDIAHERFPEAIVYFQQDYMYSPYGGSYVGRGGCGITTFAMLCTYMTDSIQTPHMLAAKYPTYHDESGTRGELFRYGPAEMGFQLDKTTSKIEEVIAALENGQMVISLQHQGHFTSGGHYLLLQKYYPDNDTFQVRDSNIYNYGKLDGHKVDYFTRENVLSGGATFYIMEKKITAIPACCRCGDGTAPEALLRQDYLCPKCAAALTRRNCFLELMNYHGTKET